MPATLPNIYLLRAPYDRYCEVDPGSVVQRGECIVWFLRPGSSAADVERVQAMRQGRTLVVILPPAEEIMQVRAVLPRIAEMAPHGVLPAGHIATPEHIQALLQLPPRDLAGRIIDYLTFRRVLRPGEMRREIRKVLELAREVTSIAALSRRLYMSRRTLGRHLETHRLPVPSHWLQFGRLMYVANQLQCGNSAVFRVATAFGYPDGFTMSNQMRRMLGIRPSQLRDYLGIEWMIDAWLDYERGFAAAEGKEFCIG